MAEKSSFFTSLNGDRRYKASDFAEYFKTFIGNGVFPNPSTNLQVVANGDMTLTLSPGYAWLNGYMYSNTDDLVLTIDHADSALKRIDRVVIRCDYVNREIRSYVKKGIFATNPMVPNLERGANAYEISVADIQVDNGVINISQSDITDTRLNSGLCGIVTQTVETIDTTTLFNQIEAYRQEFESNLEVWRAQEEQEQETWFNNTSNQLLTDFNTWFDTIKGILDGDVAGNLANRILELENKVGNGLTADNILMSDGSTVETSILNLQNQLGRQINRAKTILTDLASKVE